jgi:hypothetical protein
MNELFAKSKGGSAMLMLLAEIVIEILLELLFEGAGAMVGA